jgi:hypothetical protein
MKPSGVNIKLGSLPIPPKSDSLPQPYLAVTYRSGISEADNVFIRVRNDGSIYADILRNVSGTDATVSIPNNNIQQNGCLSFHGFYFSS